jgi:4-amino-4-deoxy-L-arabinose transferase-like glycosyltransferase
MDSRQSSSVLLIVIISVYVAIGVLYAALTPTWQVPDEPAHYNYVRALAERQGIPVIEPGDYDQAYLGRLTTDNFPPELSVESLEYEDHQPPLYYLLVTPIYLLFGGAVLPLRLASVAFGVGLLFTAFGALRAIFPRRPELALMATAFIAFIPQHVAMTAGVNNDALAEFVVGATLWALVVYADCPNTARWCERPWPIGLLLAVVLLTKTTAYVALGVAAAAVVIRWWREGRTWEWAAGQMAWMFVAALLLSTPWFIRNGFTYGWHDPLGLARHNAIVIDQPRSAEWLAAYGWGGLLGRLVRTTFQSFWGQFGWMKVVLPARIYRVLALFSALLVAGFVASFVQRRRPSRSIDSSVPRSANPQTSQLFLLTISAFLTFLSYAWYNLTFVQHQGRYLFPALVPISTAVALGLSQLVSALPSRVRAWVMAAPFVGLAVLDVYCLFKFVIPFLAR